MVGAAGYRRDTRPVFIGGYRGVTPPGYRRWMIRELSPFRKGDAPYPERTNRAVRALSGCSAVLAGATNEADLYDALCRSIVETGGYAAAIVAAGQPDAANGVRILAGDGRADIRRRFQSHWSAPSALGHGPIVRAIRTGELQIDRNPASNLPGWRSNVALPLPIAGAAGGALAIFAAEAGAFDCDELAVLTSIAGSLTLGVRGIRARCERDGAIASLEASVQQAVQALSRAVELRDPYTSGHQQRVAVLAAAIGERMGLSREDVRAIRVAAVLHDIGKIYVPAEILCKCGPLSKAEMDLMRAHPQAGAEILEKIDFPWPVAETVRQHHERLDGSGYPRGLRGDEILPAARVIAVADVVEAMVSHRPYRPALSSQRALDEIAGGRGVLYDTQAVDACLELLPGFAFDP